MGNWLPMRCSWLLYLLAAGAVAQGPTPGTTPAAAPQSLTFGVYSFKKPTDVYRDFTPAIEALATAMQTVLGGKVVVNLKVYKSYDECLDKFVAGDVDFVRFGPASYVLARQRQPKVQLLVAEQEDGQKRCLGVIAVRADSPIHGLADLKGHTFAFGDENSTIGRYLSQAELVRAGIRAEDLKSWKYLDRHDKVFKAVEIGDYDAGAMHIATFQDNNKNQQLREICRFKNVGKPWVARAGLEPRLVQALQRALLSLDDPAAMAALKVNGFLPTTDADFDVVRDGMRESTEFLVRPQPAPAPPPPGKE